MLAAACSQLAARLVQFSVPFKAGHRQLASW